MDANGLNQDDFSSSANDMKSTANEIKSDAQEGAKQLKSDAKGAASDAKSCGQDLKSDIKSEATAAAKRMKRVRDEIMHGVEIKKVLEAGKSLGQTLEEGMQAQPYAALGIAAVAGFGLGCVLGSKIGRIALGVGATIAARKLLEEVDFKELASKVFAA